MKRFVFSILLVTTAVYGAPAMAEVKEGHRIHSYYSAAERDQVSEGIVKLTKSDIKNVQTALKNAGYKPGKIDGIYGRETRAAVKKFQKDRHLRADGNPTPRTLGALRVATKVDFDHRLDRNYN
jgi:peptidoglycan hydrolase-like protein with peptidoglycan-binding domain